MDWINVKDKLPEKNTLILAFDGEDIAIMLFNNYSNWVCPHEGWEMDALYWMPLPELPII